MTKIVVYVPDYNDEHVRVLTALATGIPGAVVRPVTAYEPCDIAVIYGGVKKSFAKTHSKQTVLDRHKGRSLIMVESGFFRRGEYYQVAWGGAAGHGDFNIDRNTPIDRFAGMVDGSFPLARAWRAPNPYGLVVVCGQLQRDTQVQDTDHYKWCRTTVDFHAAKTTRVVFRPHPREDNHRVYGVDERFIDRRPMREVLDEARMVVTYNSTAGVDAALAGVPVRVEPGAGSMAEPVALNAPNPWSRDRWLAGLGYSQWTLDEMREGLPWQHLNR